MMSVRGCARSLAPSASRLAMWREPNNYWPSLTVRATPPPQGPRGGGRKPKYGPSERERILAEVRRTPDPEQDGTATWSLTLLRRVLRTAPDGLPAVSTYTIRALMRDAGFSRPRTRSWCETGASKRKRKNGEVVTVVDPDAEAKKS